MPSAALLDWQNERLLCIQQIENQCAASLAILPPNPRLVEENIRGYVVLLSAHFQGFCLALYTECAQIIGSKVRKSLELLIQNQFDANRCLDQGNPNLHNLKKDFGRFDSKLDFGAVDPTNHRRLQHLSFLMDWRNIAAHQGVVPAAGLPTLADLQDWKNSCHGLATSLDTIMYNHLRKKLRRAPGMP